MTRLIQAAGGLVFRPDKDGTQILVAHRPDYGDWSLPKGKADPGEKPEETALREVLEETGYHCRLVAPVGITRHPVDNGIKETTWFAMRPLPDSPGFVATQEIDEVRWLSPGDALDLLDYENDRHLLSTTDLDGLAKTGTLWLVRHAAAGNRNEWNEDDRLRPLTDKGRRQTGAIAAMLARRGIERIISSPYLRCIQTVEPLGEECRAEVELSDALAEGPNTDAALELLNGLVGYNAVLCSHGDVIPAVMDRLVSAGLALQSEFQCAKASIWEVEVERGQFTTAHYIPPPDV